VRCFLNPSISQSLYNAHVYVHHCFLLLPQSGNFDINDKNVNGFTALTWTCIRGDVVTTQALVEAGAEVDVTDFQGFSPLSWACTNGHLAVVRVLLAQDASLHYATSCGTSPLAWAR
jgi:ankyrin repeat protein